MKKKSWKFDGRKQDLNESKLKFLYEEKLIQKGKLNS